MDSAATPTLISERRLSRIVLGCMAIGFLSLLAAAVTAGWTVLRAQDQTRWVEHTYRVAERVSALRTAIERTEAARRGYLLQQSPKRRRMFAEAQAPIPFLIADIGKLTADNRVQQANLARVHALLVKQAAVLGASIRLADDDPLGAIVQFGRDGSLGTTRTLRAITGKMLDEEQRLLQLRIDQQRQSVELLFGVLVVSGGLLIVVGFFSIAVLRRYTRGLVHSRAAVLALNDELEARVEERTRDLSRANEEIQRFAYIVSHDLRSPLVNVMGFTGELEAASVSLRALVDAAEAQAPTILTEDARIAARDDLPESIRFIRTSTQKMDRLINAILKLSREGRRVLTPEPIDLAELADGVVAGLRHRIDEIGTEIAVVRPMPALRSDRLAIEQMLSNIVENAVKYLQPGRPGRISIAARAVKDRIEIAIADNGRGIDPRDHERIFDLFRRSGQQDQPGEGIGLAHVRALAYRLGGLITCSSTLGDGTIFTLSLPVQPVSSQG